MPEKQELAVLEGLITYKYPLPLDKGKGVKGYRAIE